MHDSETETANDRDVKETGLELGTTDFPLPKDTTVYVAGNGTITFIPADVENGKNAKLVLDNAEIENNNYGKGIFFDSTDDIDVEIKGTNKFSVYYGIISNGAINISGDGTLTVEGAMHTVGAEGDIVVNSGKIIADNCQNGLVCSETGNITVNGGTLELSIQDGNGLETTKGDITINNGTVKIKDTDESDYAYGIYAYGETDDKTGKISGGNVSIHGGTVNIDVDYDAISAYNNVKIDGSANVTATSTSEDSYDGIYTNYGDITINGHANVTTIADRYGIYINCGDITINGNANVMATGDDDGIHADEGNVNIDNNAVVTATGDKGIYAGTYDTTKDEGSIIISGSAQVTAKGKDDVAIHAKVELEISGNAVVTADGAEGEVDIEADKCTVSAPATLNAWVQTGNNYIAYGICDTNNMKSIQPAKLEVKAGAEFTVSAGTGILIPDSSALKVDGKLIIEGAVGTGVTNTVNLPEGKIVNNGQLLLVLQDTSEAADIADIIKAMKLTGTGIVGISSSGGDIEGVYTNTGKKLNNTDSLELSGETLEGSLDTDGYHWNNDTKTLTLKDVSVDVIKDRLADDVTIQTEGDVVIGDIKNIAGRKITITGDDATVMAINNRGDIIFKDITANVYGIWAYEEDDDEQKPQTLETEDAYSYGVTLINSKVTVGGGTIIYTKKLTMDDTSVLTLRYVELECDTADGLDGIEAYLPKDGGYKIGTYTYREDKSFYTILDANNNIVRDITLKKAEAPKPSGSSGGGGSSAKSYGITIKSAENGKVEASKKSASKNATITLTVTADEGYQLDKLTVLDSKNGTIALTDKTDGKFEFKMPDGSVTVEATFVKKAAEEEKPTEEKPETKAFADVSANAWFKKAVDYVNGKGLMSGVDEDNFGPELLTNRAMLVTILWRMEGCPTSEQATNFTDIKATDYFNNAVLWAAENKIVSGVSETSFAPNDSITREQLAAILYRYAAYKGYDVTQGGMAVREFSDYESISGYARGSVAWAVNAGIVSGKGNNTLDPGGVATRAEVASMLMRFCENIVK